MAADTRRLQRGPFRLHVVRGEPYYIDGRTLIPEARFLSFGKARATIRGHSIGGWGMGFVRVSPLAMIEETAEGIRRIAITDASSATLGRLLGVAVVMTAFFTALRWWARRPRGS
jgi:hypothetical protein